MTGSFEPIKVNNVVDQVIQCITDSIIKGQYKAGDKLPTEYELMEELQISRNSLREAMKILSAMGILEIKRGDGTYVCNQLKPSMFDHAIYSLLYDMSSDKEMIELRYIMDEMILRFAIQNADETDIENLKANVKEFERTLSNKEYGKAEKLDYEFHMLLIKSCKNKFFIHLMGGVYSIFENSMLQNIEYEKECSMVPTFHGNIISCLESRDVNKVEQVIGESHSTWKNRMNR